MARKPKFVPLSQVPEFVDTIELECDPLDQGAADMAWDWWAPVGGRYSVQVVTCAKGCADMMRMRDAARSPAQVFVLCEAEQMRGEPVRVRFKWLGYAMKGDFMRRAFPVYDEITHTELLALKAKDLCPIFQLWRAMVGCRVCGAAMPCIHDDEGWICNHCSANEHQ